MSYYGSHTSSESASTESIELMESTSSETVSARSTESIEAAAVTPPPQEPLTPPPTTQKDRTVDDGWQLDADYDPDVFWNLNDDPFDQYIFPPDELGGFGAFPIEPLAFGDSAGQGWPLEQNLPGEQDQPGEPAWSPIPNSSGDGLAAPLLGGIPAAGNNSIGDSVGTAFPAPEEMQFMSSPSPAVGPNLSAGVGGSSSMAREDAPVRPVAGVRPRARTGPASSIDGDGDDDSAVDSPPRLDTTPTGVKTRIEEFFRPFTFTDIQSLRELKKEDDWDAPTVEVMRVLHPLVLGKRKRGQDKDGRRPSKKPKDKDSRGPKNKSANKSANWWSNFAALQREDVGLKPEQEAVVQMGVGILSNGKSQHRTNCGTTFLDLYGARLSNMLSVEQNNALAGVQYASYALFFHIASNDDPASWVASSKKMKKLTAEMVKRMFNHGAEYLPPEMTLDEFKDKFKEWRKHGAYYAHIALHLGLGSIVHLQSLLHHTQLKGATKGNEEKVDGIKPSTAAFNHLRRVGLPDLAVKSGAEAMMHDLLWELFASFQKFPQRIDDQPFPAFSGGAEAMASEGQDMSSGRASSSSTSSRSGRDWGREQEYEEEDEEDEEDEDEEEDDD